MEKKNDVHDRLENLREAVMYAPLGLLYEYEDVMPRLVRRGKSQVQIAKLVGKAATGRPGLEKNASEVANQVSDFLAKALLEAGELLGLTPDTKPETTDAASKPTTAKAEPEPSSQAQQDSNVKKVAKPASKNPAKDTKKPAALPIAGYDKLTAKEIIQLVGDLSATQRATIRKHERANRARKTVLAKLDRLDT